MKLKFRALILKFESFCSKFRDPCLNVGVLNSDDQPLSLKDEVLRVNDQPLELDNGVAQAIAQPYIQSAIAS